ncbi:iron complex transport system permease protein [Paraburkholderia eburnea]|uniref:Iron complex transport system permease protein n=2 Tax=Paraburkholderia eburnea TaxID=1189126 RepID=A0A2S4LV27_9BURK|nr:iron complex transport system permease protein [Paraburkholderia eburnea]PRZ16260.1 iron complex transport system permease protein [Paraburkholderia eburnea]
MPSRANATIRPRRFVPIGWLVGSLLALAACLAALDLHGALAGAPFWRALFAPNLDDMRDVLVHECLLPRIAVTLMCGAALGLAGVLTQQVLRNPLAEPMTLGIFPGAYLALSVASVWWPGWLGVGRESLALAGGGLAMLVVFALAWAQGMTPISVILAGMIVNLYCGAISLAIAVLHFDLLRGLQIWGGGALDQTGWQTAQQLVWRLAASALAAALLYRPLKLFDAGDASARSLGMRVGAMRAAALFVAVALTAFVVAQVGVIGFIGLAAPLLARLAGARRLRQRLLWAPAAGAAVLWLTDELVRFASQTDMFSANLIPTGTLTSIVGVPLLIALLPRLRPAAPARQTTPPLSAPGRERSPLRLGSGWGAGLVVACVLSCVISQGPHGWAVASPARIEALAFWRIPHLAAALAAGALLASAGALLQRMSASPMASPDLLGVGSGGMFGIVIVLFAGSAASAGALFGGCIGGALVTLLALLGFGRRAQFAPERLLLVGLSISSLFQAVVGATMASGDPRAGILIDLLVGSTYYVAPAVAWSMAALALLMLALVPLTTRWLTVLGVGESISASLGVPVALARFALLLLASLATAAATLIVGPLSFVGLIAPHIARLSGARKPLAQVYLAAAVGALLMVVSDWLGRQIAFPQDVAAGLVATLIGGLWLVALMLRRGHMRS